MRSLLALVFFIGLQVSAAPARVTILHFSDYHSHAQPFFSEGKASQGGIARAIRYLKQEKSHGALVFNGGDMINKGSPAWSDKYRCAEWSWLNGVVDAMAFGNHDPDYGMPDYRRCASQINYPVLSANTDAFKPYAVFVRSGIRIGVFAIAGPDFRSLVKVPELNFTDHVAAAREAVRVLREHEKVDAVIMIGHEHAADDSALARAVDGIDVIFGSHSHLKRELTQIEGTRTWFISPYQYLSYVSRVELQFTGRKLTGVTGRLVRIDSSLREDSKVARTVASMQKALETDPEYRDFFRIVGTAANAIDIAGHERRDSALGDLVLDLMRGAAEADVAISTASSFRGGLAAGRLSLEDLRAVLPYDNEILLYEIKGEALLALLEQSASFTGTDSFAQLSGVTLDVAHPREALVTGRRIDPAATYRVATTDYLARVAKGYSSIFTAVEPLHTGRRVREELRKYFELHSPVTAVADGRIKPVSEP